MTVFPTPSFPSLAPTLETHMVQTPDGARLRVALSMVRAPLGTVCVLQGRAEYIEKYYETADFLRSRCLNALFFDWRDQGGSQTDPPSKPPDDAFLAYRRDFQTIRTFMETRSLPRPYYLLTHSMGGLVALELLFREDFFQKAVLCAPFLGFETFGFPLGGAAWICWALVKLGLGGKAIPGMGDHLLPSEFDNNPLTRDITHFIERGLVLQKYPFLNAEPVTFRWLLSALKAIAALNRLPPNTSLTCPTLALVPQYDTIAAPRHTFRFAQKHPHLIPLLFPKARHELLQEVPSTRAALWAAFENFIF